MSPSSGASFSCSMSPGQHGASHRSTDDMDLSPFWQHSSVTSGGFDWACSSPNIRAPASSNTGGPWMVSMRCIWCCLRTFIWFWVLNLCLICCCRSSLYGSKAADSPMISTIKKRTQQQQEFGSRLFDIFTPNVLWSSSSNIISNFHQLHKIFNVNFKSFNYLATMYLLE